MIRGRIDRPAATPDGNASALSDAVVYVEKLPSARRAAAPAPPAVVARAAAPGTAPEKTTKAASGAISDQPPAAPKPSWRVYPGGLGPKQPPPAKPAPTSKAKHEPAPRPAWPTGRPAAPAASIAARSDGFAPRVLAVTAGTTVEFRNSDHVFHNTFSISPAKKFDLGKYGPGDKRSVTFDRPGIVNLFCELHPEAAGFVIVVPNPVFVHANPSGAFVLPPLPPGTYTVTAWHPRFGERKTRVELTAARDAAVRLRF